jgi:dienelactone hydrolase
LVVHTALGRSPFETGRAEALARQGYAAFVADFYGQGVKPASPEAGIALARRLLGDPVQALARMIAALDALKGHPSVDASRIASMGYCLGGKASLDLARSGADVTGVICFHGGLKPSAGAKTQRIKAKVLVLHGWDDPFAPPADVAALAAELTDAGADWQIHAYGQTGHGFTDPHGPSGMAGIAYQADADRRSWKALSDFLAELFPGA